MAIGFDTPSKRQADELEGQESPQQQTMAATALQAETYERLTQLNTIIMSDSFSSLSQEQKQMILIDFTYYKTVSETI